MMQAMTLSPLARRMSAPADSFVCLPDILQERAHSAAAAIAFTYLRDGEYPGQSVTYAQLHQQVQTVAAMLQKQRLSGHRVLLCYQTEPAMIVAMLACLTAGVVAVPLGLPRPGRSSLPLESIGRDARPRVILTTMQHLDDRADALRVLAHSLGVSCIATDAVSDSTTRAMPASPVPDAPAYLQFTSGSTCRPRGVIVTQRNVAANCAAIADLVGPGPHVGVGWLPLTHDMGLVGTLFLPLWMGFPHTFMPPEVFLMKPVRWLQAISRERATLSPAPSFAYELCTRRVTPQQRGQLDLRSWQVAFNGAERVDAGVMRDFSATFQECGFQPEAFLPCYGLAEATLLVSAARRQAPARTLRFDAAALAAGQARINSTGLELVSCGRAAQGTQVCIVDPGTLIQCPDGCVGEIWVQGPGVAAGYWNAPLASAESFAAHLADAAEPSSLRTGDLGFVWEQELFVTGRLKDLVIIGGRNIAAEDIETAAEAALAQLRPGSAIAFSVGGTLREQLVLVVEVSRRLVRTATSPQIEREIRNNVTQQLDAGIDRLVLLAPGALPRTASGKKARSTCREAYESGTLRGQLHD